MRTRNIRTSGFTLIELITIMLLVGILSATAVSRFFNPDIFFSRGFSDETIAILRYAQKSAVAQRHTVCVAFTNNTVTLTIAAIAGAINCTVNLTGPNGATPYVVTARSGIVFTAIPTNFYFTSLGQASVGQNIQITGANGSITVEQETGYVHP
jgi:MSHA pilin protein MshC